MFSAAFYGSHDVCGSSGGCNDPATNSHVWHVNPYYLVYLPVVVVVAEAGAGLGGLSQVGAFLDPLSGGQERRVRGAIVHQHWGAKEGGLVLPPLSLVQPPGE